VITVAELTPAQKDALIKELTGWRSVAEMATNAQASGDTGYRPTCRVDLDTRYALVADLFDAEMDKVGFKKRAWRPVYLPWCTRAETR
jgi:hypothetical protein